MMDEDKVVSKEKFDRYVKLQKSGRVNMFAPLVAVVLNISIEEHVYIMNNYSKLEERYNENN